MIDRVKLFHDSMRGGAWPFLVRGVNRQVNSDNERDLICLTSSGSLALVACQHWTRPKELLRGTICA